MRVFEKENMRVLTKKSASERDVREAANQNFEAMMRRGRQFAPNVDVKLLETKEAVEKEGDLIRQCNSFLAALDVSCALSKVCKEYGYVRPVVDNCS